MKHNPIDTAVVFAGGKSSRMGQDKALLGFGKYNSLAEYQYIKLKKLFKTVYISTKTDKFDFKAPLLIDRYDESSPMVALASMFETLEEEAILILSVDMPMIEKPEIDKMIEAYHDNRSTAEIIVGISPRGLEPLFGIYSRKILPTVHTLLSQDTHRMKALLDSAKSIFVTYENAHSFANINTPQEYRSILS